MCTSSTGLHVYAHTLTRSRLLHVASGTLLINRSEVEAFHCSLPCLRSGSPYKRLKPLANHTSLVSLASLFGCMAPACSKEHAWFKLSSEEIRLATMWYEDDGMWPSEIAELLHRDKSTLTRLLVKKGPRKKDGRPPSLTLLWSHYSPTMAPL